MINLIFSSPVTQGAPARARTFSQLARLTKRVKSIACLARSHRRWCTHGGVWKIFAASSDENLAVSASPRHRGGGGNENGRVTPCESA